jgi:hypothetical protein
MKPVKWLPIALLLACLAAFSQGHEVFISSSCGASCEPAPKRFVIPPGREAGSFRVVSLVPGTFCAGKKGRKVAGFSIRRGNKTVMVYYTSPTGPVSDPVPLDDLVLPAGEYVLVSAPARNASASLAFKLLAAAPDKSD